MWVVDAVLQERVAQCDRHAGARAAGGSSWPRSAHAAAAGGRADGSLAVCAYFFQSQAVATAPLAGIRHSQGPAGESEPFSPSLSSCGLGHIVRRSTSFMREGVIDSMKSAAELCTGTLFLDFFEMGAECVACAVNFGRVM